MTNKNYGVRSESGMQVEAEGGWEKQKSMIAISQF
jgi:hypothetical protein